MIRAGVEVRLDACLDRLLIAPRHRRGAPTIAAAAGEVGVVEAEPRATVAVVGHAEMPPEALTRDRARLPRVGLGQPCLLGRGRGRTAEAPSRARRVLRRAVL